LNYGQRTQKRELEAFNEIAKSLYAKKQIVLDLSFIKDIGGSALTDSSLDVPKDGLKPGIPITPVPFTKWYIFIYRWGNSRKRGRRGCIYRGCGRG